MLASPLLLLAVSPGCAPEPAPPGDDGPHYAETFTAVTLDTTADAPLALAVAACAGLDNRTLGGSVYVQVDSNDAGWLDALALSPAETVTAEDYLADCVARTPSCSRYDYAAQHAVLPAILTAASVLGAVPLDTSLVAGCENVAFDATVALAGLDTPEAATRYVFEHYGDQTTGLAMLNPGYDVDTEDQANPPLTLDMSPDTVDLVFSKRLFALFFVNGCVPGDAENVLLDEIVNAGRWETPLGVYGYNDSWLVGGYLYEAQTRCLDSRNMGAIPSKVGNLSFFSTRRPAITEPGEVVPNDPQDVSYDPDKTYVAFVVGDGDNVDFILSRRNVWIQQRLDACETSPDTCAPLTWSISPHLPDLAPDILDWYYARAQTTGRDWFSLPPSGHLYSYPTSLDEEVRDRFVRETEADAALLGVHSTVHWDWYDTWEEAITDLLPRYADAEVIQAVVPVNVPYFLDAFPDWPADKFNEVLEDRVVVFRPREWRGIDGADDSTLTPEQMAAELAAYPPGTVAAIYLTSDGGLELTNSFVPLVGLLPDNVELVSTDAAARLVLEANAR